MQVHWYEQKVPIFRISGMAYSQFKSRTSQNNKQLHKVLLVHVIDLYIQQQKKRRFCLNDQNSFQVIWLYNICNLSFGT